MANPNAQGGKTWVNTRARIQRFSDSRLFAGPVLRDVEGGITIALPDGSLEVGDECSVQLFGWTTSLLFATCVLSEHGTVNFRTDKVVQANRPSPSEPRLVNRDMMATVRTEEDLLSVNILDVSPSGMGGLCDQAIEKDTSVAINMRLNDKVLRFTGKVVNCTPASAHTYRVGIRLGSTTAEDHDAWLAQFASIA